jgi:uncharacterized protein (DUF433 family)
MLDWTNCSAIERVSGKASGAWLFKGTRVPIAAAFENLSAGMSIEEFIEAFPGVTREQVEEVLRFASRDPAA